MRLKLYPMGTWRTKPGQVSFSVPTFCLTGILLASIGCGGASGGSGGSGSNQLPPVAETSPHPPIRTQYLRTDIQYNANALQFFPPHVTAYDSVHKRFFVSNTTQNRIDVFDAGTELQIGSIIVPLPWGLDVSPDGSKLYVGTTFGDVYLIDPGAMQVVQRYASATIGTQGFTATQAFILADGQLALLGAIGGLYFDGSPNFAIWNPASNTATILGAELPNFGPYIGQMAITADRSKVLIGGATAQYVELYDPSTNSVVSANVTCGQIEEILPTPDGTRIIVVGLNGNVEVLNASTLAELGSFPNVPGYSAVISQDGSTLYTVDSEANVLAWNTTTFAQTGWVPNFDVVDLQQTIVAASIDETGLIFGPIGHGVAFLDASKINSGHEGTQFNIGFLSPDTGPLSGGTALQTEVLTGVPVPSITTGTVYIGNAGTTNASLSASTFSGNTPPAAAGGAADFTVILPDNSIRMMPEDFSYGPTIVEVSTNASSADGGGQGAIFGYGFGQQPSDVQITIGGQSAAVTQLETTASPTFPYPFPMEAVLFTVPPGTSGASESVTVTTADGSATATHAFYYAAAVQSYALPGSFLSQGVYDPYRSVMYFTDRAQIDVFSPSGENWLTPITIPGTNFSTSFVGIALSPDGNTLAVSDAGNDKIYVLNPSSPSAAQSFSVNTGAGTEPYGLAVTNSGAVYYATDDQNFTTDGGLNKLDTTTGTITNFVLPGTGDSFVRVLLSPDGSHVFVNEGSGDAGVWIIDTNNDSLTEGLQATLAGDGNEDAALSGDGSVLLASDLLTDNNLNVFGDVSYVDRDVWFAVAVYGQKLNSDGSLAFQPLTNGIDVHDGTTGLLKYRVALPIQAANVYDALAIDNTDGLLFVLTANGIAQVNLSSLPPSSAESKHLRVVMSGRKPNRGLMRSLATSNTNKGQPQSARTDWLQRPRLRQAGSVEAPNLGKHSRGNEGRVK
jgi:DNA-binding beta-propeller fold protein YncE